MPSARQWAQLALWDAAGALLCIAGCIGAIDGMAPLLAVVLAPLALAATGMHARRYWLAGLTSQLGAWLNACAALLTVGVRAEPAIAYWHGPAEPLWPRPEALVPVILLVLAARLLWRLGGALQPLSRRP